jgi:uncharacterized surface protein with fasciclin (FAS1) repeats
MFMKTRLLALSALTVALSLSTACGSQGGGNSAAPAAANETASETASATASESVSASPSPSVSPSGTPFGPGCAALPATGPGSAATVATQPVATAVSSVPSLSTLATVLKKAKLVETLNSSKNITVFAPTNEAFDKVPKKRLDQLLADRKTLRALLAYHVVKGRKTPADLRKGRLTTLEGREVTITGSGDNLSINDAKVACGNIATSNATVYMIDKILMPK